MTTPEPLAPITVIAFGSAGDVFPLAGLGQRLLQRGHPVQMLCGRLHVPMVQRLGLDAVAIDTEPMPQMAVHHSPLFKTAALWRRVEQAMHAGVRHVQAQVQALPPGAPRPVLVASSFALAGRVLQERLGLRLATVHLSPVCIASACAPPRIGDFVTPTWLPLPLRQALWWAVERGLLDPAVGPELNALRAQSGMAPVRRVLGRWLHSPDLVLGLFPDWLAAPQADWPAATHLTGFPLFDPTPTSAEEGWAADPDLLRFVQAGPPPLVFYPSSGRRDARVFFDRALALSQHLGRRAILIVRDRQQVADGGALPDWALHRAFVPFAHLLPRAAALVHLGGIGGAAQALQAGVPQFILPLQFDQFDNADRLQRLGVARWRRNGSAWQRWVGPLHTLLTDPAVARACAQAQQRLQAGVRPDALDNAADQVQRLASRS